VPLNDKQRARLARDFQRAVARVAPDWTGSGAHDPGITMLELLAFVLHDLQHRRAALSPHARDVADDCGSGLRRVSYFAGQLLGVDDFQAEQDYVRGRLNRRNLLLYGTGIVTGLAVTVATDADGAHVVIAPGLAFAPDGDEVFVDAPCRLALPASGAAWLVQVAYREEPCRSVVTTTTSQPSRIVESHRASLAATPDANAVSVARVHRLRGRWRVDAKFEPPRLRG